MNGRRHDSDTSRSAGYRLRRVSVRGATASAAWEIEELQARAIVFYSNSAGGWKLSARSTTSQSPLPWLDGASHTFGAGFYWWSWGAFPTRQALLEAMRLAQERHEGQCSTDKLGRLLA